MASPQKVLFIGAVWPEPASSAGGARLMQLIHFFQQEHYQVFYGSAASQTEYSESLESLGVQCLHLKLNDASFDKQVKQIMPNVVVFDRYTSEEQYGWRVFENCPDAVRIIETIDLHCLRLSREQCFKQDATLENLEKVLLESPYAVREIASILRSDLSLILSSHEMQLLSTLFKVSSELLFYFPYPTLPYVGKKSFEEREDLVTIGNFKHAPNFDSVLHLKKDLLPLIRKAVPKTKLKVYGSYADQKVLQLHKPQEGFFIEGRAASALEVVENAKVLLAPLRFGAGIKGKVVDALSAGTPVVTTAIGIEGIASKEEWPLAISDDPQVIANQVANLLQDKSMWTAVQEKSREILANNFCQAHHEQAFAAVLMERIAHVKKFRGKHFIGKILLHQSHSATKFMSKWIEEKSKGK